MLKHRYISVAFLLLMCVFVYLGYIDVMSFWFCTLLFFVYSLITFYGVYYIRAEYFMPVYCKADTNEKVIAITFDDGPVAGKTDLVLNILKQNHIPATFFCIGKNIKTNPDLLKRITDEGHIVGNHSYTHHKFFDMYSTERMYQELAETNKLIENTIQKKAKLFRPPYGVTNPSLVKAIKRGGFLPIGWNVRSFDTMAKDGVKLMEKVTRQLKPGQVFLFHDTMEVTIGSLQLFIDSVQQQGFRIEALDKMLNIKAYE